MNNKLFKYIKYLSYVLLLLGVVVFVYFVVASVLYPEPATEFPVGTVGNAMGVNVMLIYTYVVFAVALLLSIFFPVVQIVSNPKGAMRTLIGLVAMIVIFGVSYFLASDAHIPNPAENGFFTNSTLLKLTDVGLYSAYAVLAISFIVILWGEIRSALKRS